MRKPAKQLPARLQHQKSLQAKAAWASASEILACLRMISCCSMIDRGNQSSAIWSTLVPPKPAMHLLLHSPLSSSYNHEKQAHVNMRWYLIYRAESQELSHIFKKLATFKPLMQSKQVSSDQLMYHHHHSNVWSTYNCTNCTILTSTINQHWESGACNLYWEHNCISLSRKWFLFANASVLSVFFVCNYLSFFLSFPLTEIGPLISWQASPMIFCCIFPTDKLKLVKC